MLETINATVSHEMRNPINSILCQNIEQTKLAAELEQITSELNNENVDECKGKLKNLANKLKHSIAI